jgi:hypothetical protein
MPLSFSKTRFRILRDKFLNCSAKVSLLVRPPKVIIHRANIKAKLGIKTTSEFNFLRRTGIEHRTIENKAADEPDKEIP